MCRQLANQKRSTPMQNTAQSSNQVAINQKIESERLKGEIKKDPINDK